MASKRAETLTYTEKELAAIDILRANIGSKKTAKELGIASGTLTSLVKKYNDERPMADGSEKFVLHSEKEMRPVTKEQEVTVYFID